MKSVLITGGSGKVGFQLVNYFLSIEAQVVTTTRNKTSFYETKGSMLHQNHESHLSVVEVDFTTGDASDVICHFLVKEKISPECVIHNARSLNFLKIEEDYSVTVENFAGEFYIDVIFPYKLTLQLRRELGNKINNVIFISSIYGVVAPNPSLYDHFPTSSPIQYGVAKAAQVHLVKELAVRLAPEVRVNCVSFGGIKGRVDTGFIKRYEALNPLNKMMLEEDVVGPVAFLASDQSKNMTGQNLIVDGGWTIW